MFGVVPEWMLKLTYGGRLALYRPVIDEVFRQHDLPVEWGLAIARHETGLRAWKVNRSGGDARRGNAWGLFQMTLLTANDRGFSGDPAQLLDPALNAHYAAKHIAWLNGRFHNFQDVASAYNSGRPLDKVPDTWVNPITKLREPHPTKYVYVPTVLRYAEEFRAAL